MSGLRTVHEVMASDVTPLDANGKLTIADDIMKLGRFRHLPVLDPDGRIAEFLSQRDLFPGALARAIGYGEHAQQKRLDIVYVEDVKTNDPETIGADELVTEAVRHLYERKIGCLLVVEAE